MQRIHLAAFLLAALPACDSGDGGGPAQDPDAALRAGDAQVRDARTGDAAEGAAPDVDVRPTSVTLIANVGEDAEAATIEVHNTGTAPLRVEEILLQPADPRFTLSGLPAPGASIDPGANLSFSIGFRPDGVNEVRASLLIRTNDPDEEQVTVPVTGRTLQNCLRVSPGMISMGRVQPGQQSGLFGVTISNCGDFDLNITDVRLEGDPGFRVVPPEGRDPVGPLARSAILALDVFYQNDALVPDQLAQGHLIIASDATANPVVDIELQARGDAVQGCIPAFEPARLEYGQVRIGTEQSQQILVKNLGADACGIRNVSTEKVGGPAENVFRVDAGGAVEVAPGESVPLTVTFAPTIAAPVGDRAELHFDYRDPERMENRRLSTQLLGVGAEALIGGVPDEVGFENTTALVCESTERRTAATNVGFVPLCVTGYRFEGPDCAQFVLLEEPDFAECIPLLPDEGVPFPFVFQPAREDEHRCDLIVTSDAMNFPELTIPLYGTGVPGPATVDEITVPRLEANRRAYFSLSRPAVPESISVFLNDARNDRWEFDAERNAIFFEARNHPARDDTLRIAYDARCFDRR
ncbi:MAG: choice-of-anchor D domain-containing protein [bacterium]